MSEKQESSWIGCAGVVVAAVVIIAGYRACSRQEDEQVLKRDQAAVALEASDKAEANARGISADRYREARWASNAAYAACKVAAEARAKRNYKADWIFNSSWNVKGKTISVVGRDLEMQNGFGVYERVTYYCDWDMDRKQVISLVISEN
jgi:hypothetical protein